MKLKAALILGTSLFIIVFAMNQAALADGQALEQLLQIFESKGLISPAEVKRIRDTMKEEQRKLSEKEKVLEEKEKALTQRENELKKQEEALKAESAKFSEEKKAPQTVAARPVEKAEQPLNPKRPANSVPSRSAMTTDSASEPPTRANSPCASAVCSRWTTAIMTTRKTPIRTPSIYGGRV